MNKELHWQQNFKSIFALSHQMSPQPPGFWKQYDPKPLRPPSCSSGPATFPFCRCALLLLWDEPVGAAPSPTVLPRCSPLTQHMAPRCWVLITAALFKTINRPRNSKTNSRATSSVSISGLLEYPTAVIHPASESEKNFYRLEIGFKLQCSYEKCNYS